MPSKTKLVYSPDYNFSLFGLERLHPFDSRKYGRAFGLMREKLGAKLDRHWVVPSGPVSDQSLLRVHTREYLASLYDAATVARALEIGPVRFLPGSLLRDRILAPMRLATAGTILAAELALADGGMVMNVGGGFHHAFRDRGEGFCLYADVAVAIAQLRADGRLGPKDGIMVIDLDAHRGNGFEEIVAADEAVHVFDVYNAQAYPGLLPDWDPDLQPFMIPVLPGSGDDTYRALLQTDLPKFVEASGPVKLAFYNAGTDVVAGDPVGRLNCSPAGVAARDRTVIDLLGARGIATVIVTSGGYTKLSHRLIAEMATFLLERAPTHGVVPPG